MSYRIAASILSADFAHLEDEVREAVAAGADWVHFDVKHSDDVPNLSIGHAVVQSLKRHTQRPDGSHALFDVHLRVQPVDALAERFAEAGADLISFHVGASAQVERTLQLIREAGCKAGLAFGPSESLDRLESVIDQVDSVLIMSIIPGFSARGFVEASLRRIEQARRVIDAERARSGRDIALVVDGGIHAGNIRRVADAGADTFVSGTAIFGQPDHRAAIMALREALACETSLKAAA
jgi:ribulose-phosphate 3-epimerase